MFMLFFQRLLIISIFIWLSVIFITIGNNNSNNMETIDRYTFTIYDTGYTKFGTAYQIQYLNKTYVITNEHICGNSKTMAAHSDKFTSQILEVLKVDRENDLCVLSSLNMTGGLRLSVNLPVYKHVNYFGFPKRVKTYNGGILQNKETIPLIQHKVFNETDMLNCMVDRGYIYMSNGETAYCVKNILSHTIIVKTYRGSSGSPVFYKGNVIGTVVGFNIDKTMFVESFKLINLLKTIKE